MTSGTLDDWDGEGLSNPYSQGTNRTTIQVLKSQTVDEWDTAPAKSSVECSILTNHPTTTHSKGSAILGDGAFETLVREKTKQRKEKEDLSIAELRVCMADMEKALKQEQTKRLESTTSLQRTCAEKIADMEQRLNDMIDRRVTSVQDRLNWIEAKVQDLNVRFEEERIRIPADIERMGKEIQLALRSLQEDFVMERHDRMERENRFITRISEHAQLMDERWNQERKERTMAIQNIQKEVMENQQFLLCEALCEDRNGGTCTDLQTLVDALERERYERIMEDEEIIQALHKYTEKLETSLSIINGDC